MSAEPLDINAIRTKLQGTNGPQYWRSLEAVAETPEFKEFLHREFPANASEWNDPVGRRGFLKLMSASLALAGVAGCTVQPDELIVPYVRQPEEMVPGKPLFYATAMSLGGVATGLLVESHEGRPTKIEGNPDHPATKGGTDLYAQASVLSLYDPDRSNTITQDGEVRPWSSFVAAVKGVLSAQIPTKGAGLRIVTSVDQNLQERSLPTRSGCSGNRPRVTTPAPARNWRSASTSSRCSTSRRPTSSSPSTATSWPPRTRWA